MKKGINKKLLFMLVLMSVICVNSVILSHRHHDGWGVGVGGVGVGVGGGGVGVAIGGHHHGIAIGIGADYWDRPEWSSWNGPYWGLRGNWVVYNSEWVSSDNCGPKIWNNTGQRIKFYVSDCDDSQYTLTVVTEDGQTRTFEGLDMGRVEVSFDNNDQLIVMPK